MNNNDIEAPNPGYWSWKMLHFFKRGHFFIFISSFWIPTRHVGGKIYIDIVTIQLFSLHTVRHRLSNSITLRKKGTKAVTGAVPFQKVNFCPF